MDYIRSYYGVPAKRGGRVVYEGSGTERFGTITGSYGAHLRIRLDGEAHSSVYHPTWRMRYLGSHA